MARTQPPGFDRAAAVEAVGTWLTTSLGAVTLSAPGLSEYRPDREACGWRLAFETADCIVTIDLVMDGQFPLSKPEVYWVDAPPFPSIPHVEKTGRICVLPPATSVNPLEPIAIIRTVLAGVESVVSAGLAGENADEFRTEFLSYWNEVALGVPVTSLIDPCEPSRMVRGWFGKKLFVVAETADSLRNWLLNVYGKKQVAGAAIHDVPLIWLDQPLLPNEYPATEGGLAEIVGTAGEAAIEVYERAISSEAATTLILLGADSGDNAICFGAVTLSGKSLPFARSRRRVTGFRDRVPRQLLRASRARDRISLSAVARADPWWVHGRDTQDDLETLLAAKVALIGCGSLGSPVARLLAQAGVKHLVLIDPEKMTFANAGRHMLGVSDVDHNKAVRLKQRLEREFPHALIEAYAESWRTVASKEPGPLQNCDLVISSIGDWESECELNNFSIATPHFPPTLYAWGEPHAVGGHSVVVGDGSGCLACGLSEFGDPLFQVAKFEGMTLRREPACGAFFQPYGAADITSIARATIGP